MYLRVAIRLVSLVLVFKEVIMEDLNPANQMVRVNGVPLHAEGASLTTDELHQRAYSELLRQTAMQKGLLNQKAAW